MSKLSPSILSADFSKLGQQAEAVTQAGADYIHVDIMDGHFVPNISFGPAVMKSLNQWDTCPYDVHLMIENPDMFIGDFATDKTEYITVHREACVHLSRTIQNIKSHGIKAGVSINPATPVSTLENILADVDMVLIMSVNPGFGGQQFIESSLAKIKELDWIRKEKNYDYLIETDGGITTENVRTVIEAGCDIVVAGSAIFKADDIGKRVKEFKEYLK